MCIYTSLQESCSGEGGESNFFHKCAYSATRNMRSFLHSANMRRAPILSSALLVNWMKLWTRETCSLRRKYRFIKYSLATCSSWAAFLSGWRVQVILQLCLRDHSCAVCLVIPGPSGEGFLLSPDVSYPPSSAILREQNDPVTPSHRLFYNLRLHGYLTILSLQLFWHKETGAVLSWCFVHVLTSPLSLLNLFLTFWSWCGLYLRFSL